MFQILLSKILHSISAATLLVCSFARADGFELVPQGGLTAHPLNVEAQANLISPVANVGFFRLLKDEASKYFVATGLGVPKLNISDDPRAAAWAVVPDADCASLRAVGLAEVKRADVTGITVKSAALPYGCAASFEGGCKSKDGRLAVATRFEGTYRIKKVGGGFFGTEGKIDAHFYTGKRTLSIQHFASGKKIEYQEKLKDVQGYNTAENQLVYLPEHSLVLLIGLPAANKAPIAECIKLP
jgi:hypothetical protein